MNLNVNGVNEETVFRHTICELLAIVQLGKMFLGTYIVYMYKAAQRRLTRLNEATRVVCLSDSQLLCGHFVCVDSTSRGHNLLLYGFLMAQICCGFVYIPT